MRRRWCLFSCITRPFASEMKSAGVIRSSLRECRGDSHTHWRVPRVNCRSRIIVKVIVHSPWNQCCCHYWPLQKQLKQRVLQCFIPISALLMTKRLGFSFKKSKLSLLPDFTIIPFNKNKLKCNPYRSIFLLTAYYSLWID